MLRLKYLQRFTDNRGTERYYFRRPGFPRVALPGLPGSPAFMQAYDAALKAEATPIGKDRLQPGSIAALIASYKQSADFQQLRASTRNVYTGIMARLQAECGTFPVATLKAHQVKNMIDERAATPSAANHLRRMLNLLMRHAVENCWRDDNPIRNVRKLKESSPGFHTWSESEIAQFEAKHKRGTRARLAFDLLLYTGQRRGDVVRMGRQHVRDGWLTITQEKTGAVVSIPIHSELQASLDSYPSDHLTFLTTTAGASFTSAGFGNWFRDMCNEAGMPRECSAHGLRKAACRRLAEAGCTPHDIMAISGHVTLTEVERYTRAASRRQGAARAMGVIQSNFGTKK